MESISDPAQQQSHLDHLCSTSLAQATGYLPLLQLKLTCQTKLSPRNDRDIVAAADAILDSIDQKELAAFLFFPTRSGDAIDKKDKNAVKLRDKNQELKMILINALFAKAVALSNLISSGVTELRQQFINTYILLTDWTDTKSDSKFTELKVTIDIMRGNTGSALANLNKAIGNSRTKSTLQKRILFLKNLGGMYLDIADREELSVLAEFPASFRIS